MWNDATIREGTKVMMFDFQIESNCTLFCCNNNLGIFSERVMKFDYFLEGEDKEADKKRTPSLY